MKKILLILVGGTICTELNERGTLSIQEPAGIKLQEFYQKSDSPYAKQVEFVLSENLLILSENMTVEQWNRIINTYREWIVKDVYDGVIFAHGTDTLAYSATLFSMILSQIDIPVFFVSSNRRLSSPKANGNDNFKTAVECICRGIKPNVYVTYRNLSDNRMYLHLASRITQCNNYSEDFHSVGALDITGMTQENYREYFSRLDKTYPKQKRKPPISISEDWQLSDCVLMIQPYVGLDYSVLDCRRFLAILHGTFHSGTVCVQQADQNEGYGKNSILYLLDQCAKADHLIDVYLSPSTLSGEIYDSVRIIQDHFDLTQQIHFLYGCTTEATYAKLTIAYSVFQDANEIKNYLETEWNFEQIDSHLQFQKGEQP